MLRTTTVKIQIFDYSLSESVIESALSLCDLNGANLDPYTSWDKSFTKVSPSNPGAKNEQPGICGNRLQLESIGHTPT